MFSISVIYNQQEMVIKKYKMETIVEKDISFHREIVQIYVQYLGFSLKF